MANIIQGIVRDFEEIYVSVSMFYNRVAKKEKCCSNNAFFKIKS